MITDKKILLLLLLLISPNEHSVQNIQLKTCNIIGCSYPEKSIVFNTNSMHDNIDFIKMYAILCTIQGYQLHITIS